MNELEKLIEQKKEIERKIKALKNQSIECGFVKIDVEHYPTAKPDRHYLAIKYQPIDGGRAKFQTLFSAFDKQSVIDEIPKIIENLQKLYSAATEGRKE